MGLRISCPCCGSLQIRKRVFASFDGVIGTHIETECSCLSCGETCEHPEQPTCESSKLNFLMGVAVLVMILGIAVGCIV
jgi:hypothetical protein